MLRKATLAVVGMACLAVGALAIAQSPTTTAPVLLGSSTAADGLTRGIPAAPFARPPMPGFTGANGGPPRFEAPAGGSESLDITPGGQRRVTLRHPDGRVFAIGFVSRSGSYEGFEYFLGDEILDIRY
jgi:hypothetical protein